MLANFRSVARARKGAFTLVEMVVAIAIIGIMGVTVFVANASTSQRGLSELDNVEKAARTLTDLSEAIALWTERRSGPPTSFYHIIGANPGRLSQLTTPITTTDRNSCGLGTPLNNATRYKNSEVGLWEGQFFRQELPTTGFLVAPGFFANDVMLRYSAVFNPAGPPYFVQQYFPTGDETTAGTLAIVMPSVRYTDAVALAQRVEGDTIGIFGAVRFTRNTTNTPVTVEYHIGIHGC
jgi:prepilin-type N-terminal cleavage/methylation domain-containing protein